MSGNPFDFNRDGRWSTPERAFTHYGVDPLMRRGGRGGADGRSGCGCTLVLLGLLVALYVFLLVLGSLPD